MMRKGRPMRVLTAIFALFLLLAGCSGSKPAPAPAPAANSTAAPAAPAAPAEIPQVTIGLNSEIRTLDATAVVDTLSRGVFIQIFDPLLHRKPDGTIENRLAENYEQVSPTVARITLRKGVKFSDGSELTADDVKFSLDRYHDKTISEGSAIAATIKEVRVKDKSTVEIETKTPDPIFKAAMADTFFIVSKAALEKDPKAFARNPVGSGPYAFKVWNQGDRLEVDRRDDYWGPKPLVKKVVWRFIPEPSTRVAALLSGQVDIVDEVPAQQVSAVNGNPTTAVLAQPALNITYINMRWDDPILKDKRVRQALNYAVDKEALIKGVLAGQGEVMTQMILKGMIGYDPNLNPYKYDPDKAKKLLADAGYPNGFTIDLEIPIGGPVVQAKAAAEAVAGDWAKVGVKANLITTEWGTFFKKLFTPGQPALSPAYVMYVKMSAYDPEEEVGRLFRTAGDWNWTHYAVPSIHDLLVQGASNLDQAKRTEIYTKVDQQMTEDPPFVMLFQPVHLIGARKSLNYVRPFANMIWVVDMLGK